MADFKILNGYDVKDETARTGVNHLDERIGNLNSLVTNTKSTIVGAINEVAYTTAWITLTPQISYRRVGQIIFVVGESQGDVLIGDGSYTILGTLPEDFRPQFRTGFTANFKGGIHEGQACSIESDGKIEMFLPAGDTTEYWEWSVSFPLPYHVEE